MVYASMLVVGLIIIGTLGYKTLEGWSFLDALYATIITLTTVGYGDMSPRSMGGRLFAIFFTLTAIGIAGYALSTVAAYVFDREHERVRRIIRERKMRQIANLKDHIILCGGGYVGKRTAREFYKMQTPFIIVEPSVDLLRWTLLYLQEDYALKKTRELHDPTYVFEDDALEDELHEVAALAEAIDVLYLQENPTQDRTLLRAGIGRAKGLVAALDDDKENLFVVLSARELARRLDNPNIRIVSRVIDEENSKKLLAAGADKIVSPNAIGGLQLASEMIRPAVASLFDQMLHEIEPMLRFIEIHLDTRPELAGQTVADLRQKMGLAVIAIKRAGHYQYNLKPKTQIENDDVLLVIGTLEG